MPVTYIVRSPGTGHSIEALFDNVRRELTRQTGEAARIVYLPHVSRDLSSVRKNIRFLRMLAKHRGADEIFHITGDVHYAVLVLPPAKTVLTIHDCSTLLNNQKRRLHYLFFWVFWYYLPVHRAALVTVISEKTRQELIQYLGRVAEKAVVIHNGYSPEIQPGITPEKCNKPVLLQLGTAPNKNLLRLLEAIEAIPCTLLIVGKLAARQVYLLHQYNIEYENFTDADEMTIRELYIRCSLVTFLSTYEGFGMPVLEANASGRPVITSDIDPLRYIAGNAACLVDPTDVPAIREAILYVLTNDAYRQQLIENGLQNARRFTIDQIGTQYRAAYQRLSACHQRAELSTS